MNYGEFLSSSGVANRLPATILRGSGSFIWACLLLPVLYSSTSLDLYRLWVISDTNSSYGHGVLLVPVAALLLGRRWKEDPPEIRVSWLGILGLFGASVSWYLASVVDIRIGQQMSFLSLFPLLAWAMFGWRQFRMLAFPLILPLCAIPIWEVINEVWFQQLTATTVADYLKFAGVPVSVDGVLLTIPEGVFRVAENCSGMRQLVVAVPIALLFAYLNGYAWWAMVLWGALGALLAFLVNTLRIFIVVLSGHLSNMQHYFVTEDHIWLGWVLFAFAIVIFLAVSYALPTSVVSFFQGSSYQAESSPLSYRARNPRVATKLLITIVAVAGPLLCLLPHVNSATSTVIELPQRAGDWELSMYNVTNTDTQAGSRDDLAVGVYQHPQLGAVRLYVATFTEQTQGQEAVVRPNDMFSADQLIGAPPKILAPEDPLAPASVVEAVRNEHSKPVFVWAWYRVFGIDTANAATAKALELVNRFFGDGCTRRLTLETTATGDLRADRHRLADFWASLAPALITSTPLQTGTTTAGRSQ